jgi:hypothetical protein
MLSSESSAIEEGGLAMSRFTAPLAVSPLADGRTWVVLRAFGYDVGEKGSGDRIDVAVGFMTDFASIPRLLWAALPVWGKYGNACVIHDWLYWQQERPRAAADRILLEAMAVLDVGRSTRWAIFAAVRIFGGIAWLRNRADRLAGAQRVLRAPFAAGRPAAPRIGQARRLWRHATGRWKTRRRART